MFNNTTSSAEGNMAIEAKGRRLYSTFSYIREGLQGWNWGVASTADENTETVFNYITVSAL